MNKTTEIFLNTHFKKSPNYKKYIAIIDDEDFERVNEYNWHVLKVRNNLYATTTSNGAFVYLHRFIMNAKKGEQIDHKNGNGLLNCKSNLRFCTPSQNVMNSKPKKNTFSNFKGVYGKTSSGKWITAICHNYKKLHIGCFATEIEGAIAYNKKAKELFGEFARLNIIPKT